MGDEHPGTRPDWLVEVGSPVPAVTSDAHASLQQLATLSAQCTTEHNLLAASTCVDAFVLAAVAGGATSRHIATSLRVSLRDAHALVNGLPFEHLFSAERGQP